MSRSLTSRTNNFGRSLDQSSNEQTTTTESVDSKLTEIMKEPSCPSAWNSFLPITFIPKALKTGAGRAVCTEKIKIRGIKKIFPKTCSIFKFFCMDPFFAQLHNKPQIRLIIASQVAAWKLERSDSMTTEIL